MSDDKEHYNKLTDDDDSFDIPQNEEFTSKTSSITFFDKIIEFFTGISSDERIKQKKLKDIYKKFRRLKYKFYNFKKDQILPPLGQYFYDIYRMCQNIQRYFDIKVHSKSIKQTVFEIFSNEKQKNLAEELDKDNINNFINLRPNTKELIEDIKIKLTEYIKSFTPEVIKRINSTYNNVADLSNIISFDWFSLMHKFDPEITEANINYKPDFELIEGKYILDELIVIADALETINFNNDWKDILFYLKSFSDDVNNQKVLKKLLQYIKILKKDEYILLLIKLIYKDPFFKPKQFSSKSTIVQDYLYNFQLDVKRVVELQLKKIKKEKINKLLSDIFGTTAIIRLKNYSQRTNQLIQKKNVSGFRFIDPLNYLKAFLLDFCKGEIKARIDFLIIKGTWVTSSHSQEYSRLLEEYNKLTDRVVDFDNSCAEDEYYGKNIRKLSFAVSHDPNAKILLNKTIYKIDQEAMGLINDGIRLFNQSAEKFKSIIDDYNSQTPKIIVNFHTLKWDYVNDFPEEFEMINNKLFNFINLLKYYTKTPAKQ